MFPSPGSSSVVFLGESRLGEMNARRYSIAEFGWLIHRRNRWDGSAREHGPAFRYGNVGNLIEEPASRSPRSWTAGIERLDEATGSQ